MNQEKIGKFIASVRKEQNLTQEELAEKLGITSKAVSKWECGKGLPDASIMIDLCKILKITVNDLLSGEKVTKEQYQEKLEANIIDTIDYSNKKDNEKNKKIAKIIMLFGIFIIFSAFSMFSSDSSWGAIYSILGLMISVIGFYLFNLKKTIIQRLLLSGGYLILFFLLLISIDYTNVILNNVPPRYSYLITTSEDMIVYKAPLCNVYRINRNTKNEYYIVDTKKDYNENTIPITPFNRSKSGIDNLLKFKSKYIGDNSNDSHLIDSLPLSEYGYVFQIDDNNLELIINYNITDWYIDNNKYLEKSLLYNTVAIFSLIDNAQNLTFNFSGNNYKTSRVKVAEEYPYFKDIINNKDNFNKYLENKINDNEFVEVIFNKIFK